MSIKHQNNFATTLATAISATDTSANLTDFPTVDAPFYLALDAANDNGNYEVIKVLTAATPAITFAACDNDHTVAEEVRMVFPAEEINPALTTDADAATITLDLSTSLHQTTITDDRTLALENETVGQAFTIRITQDGTGSRLITFFTTIKWADGVTPTLTTTPSKTDVFGFICTSAGNYDGFIIGQNL